MASNDLANIAAATAAKYSLVQVDRGTGATAVERFQTVLEKTVGGVVGDPVVIIRATGFGSTQNNADTAALANLNYQRDNRYGFDSAAASASSTLGANSAAAAASTKRHTKDST